MNRFLNFIRNQEGQQIAIMMIDGYVVEGKAVVFENRPFIMQANGVITAPMDDSKMVLVWPKYHTKWMDAIEFGDNAFHDLDGSREMRFILSCEEAGQQ